jgi:hypothetical protein
MHKEIISNWLAEHKSTTLPGWLNRNPLVRDWVVDQTAQYLTKNIMESVFIIFNGAQPICEFNKPLQFNTFELGYRKGCILGNKCKCVANLRMAGLKLTLQNKYGVDNANFIPGVAEKRKTTMLANLGTPFASQAESVKEKHRITVSNKSAADNALTLQKRKQTFLNTYGVDHHMKLKSQQEKLFATNLKKYNAKVPMQNADIRAKVSEIHNNKTQLQKEQMRQKSQQTLLEKYGVNTPSRIGISQSILNILDSKEKLSAEISGKTRNEVIKALGIAGHTLYLYAKNYDIQDLFIKDVSSEPENEINEYIKSLGLETEIGNRTILNGKEVDIFIPALNIAIEHNGLYYHGERSGRGKYYHYDKYKMCAEQDITLITIFGDEWQYNQDKVKNRLAHILKKTSTHIYARKCHIEELSTLQVSTFINSYHLQGAIPASINLGLFYEAELVSVMNFSKARFNKKYEYEIIRFCSSANVVGGASKLFKYFINHYNPNSVLSYSDNRWGHGKVYENLGMVKEKETIGFFYSDNNHRYNRAKFQKHKLVAEGHDPSLTAKVIMQDKQYDIVWDCGQSLWVWNK